MEQNEFYPETKSLSSTVSEKYSGIRLDHYLVQTAAAGLSRSLIISSIKAGLVKVNDCKVKAGYRLRPDDCITGYIEPAVSEGVPTAQPVIFDVLQEDPALLIISKPAGLVVHPGAGNPDNTLVNGLLYHYKDLSGVGDETRPGIVHRLDKDTSGVMLVARTIDSHRKLVQDFKDRRIEKRYLALLHGIPDKGNGRIVAPIGRHPINRQKMSVRESDGRYAVSNWSVKEVFERHCLVEVHIETGRTHQIRVHMAHIGHPVAGDQVYGSHRQNGLFPRQMLHAWKLRFNHPLSGREIAVEAPVPDDFLRIHDILGGSGC